MFNPEAIPCGASKHDILPDFFTRHTVRGHDHNSIQFNSLEGDQ